ncbi:MAG: metallophosphoesterase family protein [Myxococcales bacterium]
MPNAPLRLLHISDLHFSSGADRRATVDDKAHKPGLSVFVAENETRAFFNQLKRLFGRQPEDLWPKAVIVTGDLVNRGGTDIQDGRSEFHAAREFLVDLAAWLKIDRKRIIVVPGNHDVTWGGQHSQLERFNAFLQHTKEFTAPTITNGQLSPARVPLKIREGVEVELLLLVSPTFSGMPDAASDVFFEQIADRVSELDPGVREALLQQIRVTRRSLDIAAIGEYQRSFFGASAADERPRGDLEPTPIRIAVMHHHLLPDSEIEISQFEAVVDSGKVIQELLHARFDLVLTGHKHNRRLAQYRTNNQTIDVSSAPSLFLTGGSPPGFSVIDIFGTKSPWYASIFEYARGYDLPHRTDLVRVGRIRDDVLKCSASLSQDDQERRLLPVLTALERIAEWLQDPSAPVDLADKVLRQTFVDLEQVAARTLTFRSPELAERWSELIGIAGSRGTKELQLVSDGDLSYWIEARNAGSEAAKYREPLRAFRGNKTRIMILAPTLRYDQERAKADQAIADMLADGFRVLVVKSRAINFELPTGRDFGIISDFAVSKFHGMGESARALTESFNRETLSLARVDWANLQRVSAWDSAKEVPFAQWAKETRWE